MSRPITPVVQFVVTTAPPVVQGWWRRFLLGGGWLMVTAGILVGVTAFTLAYQYDLLVSVANRDFSRKLTAETILVADIIARVPPAERSKLAGPMPLDCDHRLSVLDPNGKVIVDTAQDLAALDNHNDRPEVIEARRTGFGMSRRISRSMQREFVYSAKALPDGWVVRVSALSEVEFRHVIEGWWPLALSSSLVIVVAGLVVALQWLRDHHRFGELAGVARAFAAGSLDRRAGLLGTDALARLGHELNRMGDHLAASRAELASKQALLDSALGALSEGVACIDRLDRVVFANAAYRQLAAGGAEVLTQAYYVHFPDAAVTGALEALRAGDPSRPVDGIACEHRRRHLVATLAPVGDGVVVLVLYDRTDVKRLEAIRRSFVASVSHEFKTPLTSIIGYTDTLLDGALEDESAARQFAEKIQLHATRLEVLVRDVLTLSRLEQGAWSPLPVDLDLVPLVAAVVDEHRQVAVDRRVALSVQAPDELPVHADPELLRQIVANLLSNAIRYNRTDGKVVIRVARTSEDRIRIEVEDTGIGIPNEVKGRIFERFYRVDLHRSRASGGTGLGLAIVKHMIESMDGSIDFVSSPQGTTFTVELPLPPPGGDQVP
ncbi:hypothetical protein LBMAG53_16290 [Planctomycetota bacterium]|nr:hypothetical protein LBMAG53_16290 [Planctomycetota bacterium]